MSRNLRQVELVMYRLQQDWGLYLDILCPCETTHNVRTGEITRSWRRLSKIKAIVLPFDSEYAQPNQARPLGVYDEDRRQAIIRAADLPADFSFTKECHLQFKSSRWEIAELYHTEDDSSWRAELIRLKNIDIAYD